jgi:hypothetical protein
MLVRACREGWSAFHRRPREALVPSVKSQAQPRLRLPWPFVLDRELARGTDPLSSPRLARRAAKLCQPSRRTKLATEIERIIEAAEEPRRPFTAAVPLNRCAIRDLRPLLLTIADDLRADEPVGAGGVAMVRQLLRDGSSPLYGPVDPGELEEELRRARAALLLA